MPTSDANGKSAGSTSQDIGQATGEVVKMGKQATKIAGKVAAQDYAGAAIEAAKDPETTVKIALVPILIAALCIFLVVAILFSIPTAIYDNLCSYFDDISNKWEEIWYGNDGANAIQKFCDWIGYSLSRPFAAIIDAVEDFISPEKAKQELKIMGSEPAEKVALLNRLCIVDQKLQSRGDTLKTGLTSDELKLSLSKYLRKQLWGIDWSDPTPRGCRWYNPIVKVIYQAPLEAEDVRVTRSDRLTELTNELQNYPTNGTADERMTWEDEFNKKIYDKENDGGYFKPEDESLGLQLLSLLSVQKGASTIDMENIDLIKKMGWTQKGFTPSNIEFAVGGVDSCVCTVPKWQGTFIPQYMEEEIKNITQMREHYRRLGDTENENKCQEALDRYNENAGVALADLALKVDFPLITLRENGVELDPEITENPKISVGRNGVTHQYYYYKNPLGGLGKLTLHCWLYQNTETWHYQFEIETYICCRDATEIADAVGLFEGAFKPQYALPATPTPAPTTEP